MKKEVKCVRVNHRTRTYLLNNLALVVTGGEIIEIDDLLDIGLHVADELELNIGLKQGASDLVEALVQDLLVDYGRIAHLLESTRDAPSQLRQHHLC